MVDEQTAVIEQEAPETKKKLSYAEKKAIAKKRDILAVCEALGIELERKGKVIRGVEHDSLVFYPDKNRFKWFSQDIGGDVISLVETFSDRDFNQAVEFLNTEDLSETKVVYKEKTKKPFYYYVKETDDFTLARNYLVDLRGLDANLVDKFHDEGYLVQAMYMAQYPDSKELSPCVVAKWERRGELVGGTIQGLIYDEELYGKRGRDKKIMANSEPSYGWTYTIGTPDKLVIAESFIDLLSYMSLHPELDNCMFADLEGLKVQSVSEFIKTIVVEKNGSIENGVISAVDNDVAAQKFIDSLISKYQFTSKENFKLAQPFNNAVLKEHMLIYQRAGKEAGVDPIAIAAVHKAYTNGENTNALSNPWKNDQYYGKVLKPKEKPQEINVVQESQKVASSLARVKSSMNDYDFTKMVTQFKDTNETRAMGEKLNRIYKMYQTEGIEVKDEILKDWNDVLRSTQKKQDIERNNEELTNSVSSISEKSKIEILEESTVDGITNENQADKQINISQADIMSLEASIPMEMGPMEQETINQTISVENQEAIKDELNSLENRTTKKEQIDSDKIEKISKEPQTDKSQSVVLFHGSPVSFDQFELQSTHSSGGTAMGYGIYFSDSKERAEMYANEGYIYEVEGEVLNARGLLGNEVTLDVNEIESIISSIAQSQIDGKDEYPYILTEFGAEVSSEIEMDEGNQAIAYEMAETIYKDEVDDLSIVNSIYQLLGGDSAIENTEFLNSALEELNIKYGVQEFIGENNISSQEYVVFNPKNIQILNKDNLSQEQNKEVKQNNPAIDSVVMENEIKSFQERMRLDQKQFEEQILKLSPKEIFEQSEIIVTRGMLAENIESWLPTLDVSIVASNRLLNALIASEEPITDSYASIKDTNMILTNQELFENEFPNLFVQYTEQKEPKADKPFTLSTEAENQMNVVLEGISQEVTELNSEENTPVKEMRLSLQIEYLKQQLIDNQLLVKNDNQIEPGELSDKLLKDSKEKELVTAFTSSPGLSPFEVAQMLSSIHQKVSPEEEMETNTIKLSAFKEWANNYDGVSQEYIPLEEINELEMTSENKLELESASTWFDSLEDYLATHKEFNFGQSVAIQNAMVFIQNIDKEDRDLLVLSDQLKAGEKVVFDGRDKESIPEGTRNLYNNTKVTWGIQQGETWKPADKNQLVNEKSNLKPIIVVELPGDDLKVFSNFTEFNEFSINVNKEAEKQVQLDKQKGNLEKEVTALKEWAQNYNGLDKEYIPYNELNALTVALNEFGTYAIKDVVNGEFIREYDNVTAFLQSFDGNVWKETVSYESAVTYFSNRDNKDRLNYELISQNLLAKKDEMVRMPLDSVEQEITTAAWKNIFVSDFDTWKQSTNKKMIYFQDPTRVGNPIFFENQKQAEQFVINIVYHNEEVTKEREQKEKEEQSKKGFFRRIKNEVATTLSVNDEKEKDGENNPTIPPVTKEEGSKITEEVLFDRGTLQENKVKREAEITKKYSAPATTKDLIDQAKQGVKDFLDSDKFKNYLKTMSQFHNYSWSNTMLIMQQMPNATAVAGFQTWKNKFNRHVVKGQKGIKILAPVIYNQETEKEKEVNGKKEKVVEQVTTKKFKSMTVFDVSQTDGEPLPTLVNELEGSVKDYSKLFEAIASTTEYKIEFEDISNGAKGYCNFTDKRIALNKGMSETQTIKTLIHEITHSHLHEPEIRKGKNKQTMEVEAESTAFVVCSKYGLDTSEYSFGYLASWSEGKDVKEITQSFATIQKQADKLIGKINEGLIELSKDQEQVKGVSTKLDTARDRSKMYNEEVKKSQAQAQQQGKKKQPKER